MIDVDFPTGPQVAVIHQQPCGRDCRKQVREARRQRRQLRRARLTIAPYRGWLQSLAWCESTNNPRAIGGGGLYRGLYQFDFTTWYSVGGRGDPINATRLEQSYRAVLLYKQRGTAPWPVCG